MNRQGKCLSQKTIKFENYKQEMDWVLLPTPSGNIVIKSFHEDLYFNYEFELSDDQSEFKLIEHTKEADLWSIVKPDDLD